MLDSLIQVLEKDMLSLKEKRAKVIKRVQMGLANASYIDYLDGLIDGTQSTLVLVMAQKRIWKLQHEVMITGKLL